MIPNCWVEKFNLKAPEGPSTVIKQIELNNWKFKKINLIKIKKYKSRLESMQRLSTTLGAEISSLESGLPDGIHIIIPKIPSLSLFWMALKWKMLVHSANFCHLPFGIFPVLVWCNRKNLATLSWFLWNTLNLYPRIKKYPTMILKKSLD
jgi:hypothetical protein